MFRTLGHIAAIAIFHEASHTMRWRTAGPLADATQVVEEGLNPTLETTYWAAINRELKLYREEVLAYAADKGVTASYYLEVGIDTREEAARRLANTDPTQGTSATASYNRLQQMILDYEVQAKRDVEMERFLRDAHTWAATGENMPDFRKYLMP